MDLQAILATMIADEGLSLALIVGRDGLLVEGQCRGDSLDLPSIGAMATRSLVGLDRMERVLASGPVNRLRLFFGSYQLLIEPVSESDILVAGVSNATDGGMLLDAVARCRGDLQRVLGDL
jgi:predicted regulator of Ras-like GTPase activity (Roadblock/LC7/MglB family)